MRDPNSSITSSIGPLVVMSTPPSLMVSTG